MFDGFVAYQSSFLLDNSFPTIVFAIYTLVYLAVLVLFYRSGGPTLTSRARHLLTAMRAVTVLLVLFLLLNPSIVRNRPYSSAEKIIVMLDTSKSMTIKDGPEGSSRFDQMQQIITDTSLIDRLGEVLPVVEYRFDSFPRQVKDPSEMGADGNMTRLLRSLEKISAVSDAGKTKAVVLMTDGADTSEDNFLETIKELNRRDIAVYPVGFGSDKPQKDISISKIKVNRNVARNTEAVIDVFIDQYGYDGEMLPVKLMKGDKPIESSGVFLEGDTAKVALRFTPKVEGVHKLTVLIEEQKDEAFPDNNVQSFSVNVIRAKLNILYMEGTMYRIAERELWEYQYLEQAVLETPDMEIKTLFRDQTKEAYLAGVSWIQDPVSGFPTSKRDLFKYDILIASDIDLIYFTEEQLGWIVEFVEKHGGGFVMIGGWTSFGSGGYDESVIDKMLPVDMQGRADGYFEGATFKMTVTPEGRKHPIFQISDENNNEIIDSVPFFKGTNRVQRAKPHAVTIAEHPFYRTAFGPMPLIAVQEYGRGRSMAFTSDTTAGWGELFENDWGEEGDNRYYRKFWQNAFRWLGQYRLARPSKYVLIETDKVSYGTDEEIPLTVEVNDENFEPTSEATVTIRITSPEGEKTEIDLSPDFRRIGKYTGSFQPEKIGRYEIEAYGYMKGTQLDTDVMQIDVSEPNIEFNNYVRNDFLLRRLARFTGGRMLAAEEVTDLPGIIRNTRGITERSLTETNSIWDKWPFLLVLFALLTAEWILRKRAGLA